jgi:hypothetical protein
MNVSPVVILLALILLGVVLLLFGVALDGR